MKTKKKKSRINKTVLALVLLLLVIALILLFPQFSGDKTDVRRESELDISEDYDESNLSGRIVESFSMDEVTVVEYLTEPENESADAFVQFRFEGYDSNEPVSDNISYRVMDGESLNLEIVRCIWTPEHNAVHIGLYAQDSKTGYAYEFEGGDISEVVEFAELPAGEYIVYIKNMGEESISDGTIRYRIA